MPDNPTCPWCGAEATEWSLLVDRGRWACFSHKFGPEPYQSVDCRSNVLEAENERLRSLICNHFSYDRSMRKEGCDTIGCSIVPLSKEDRLTIIQVLSEAPGATTDGQ